MKMPLGMKLPKSWHQAEKKQRKGVSMSHKYINKGCAVHDIKVRKDRITTNDDDGGDIITWKTRFTSG